VTTIGWYITGKTKDTKKDDIMKFMSFENQTGIYQNVFSKDIQPLLTHSEPITSLYHEGKSEGKLRCHNHGGKLDRVSG
jgi:hypothetical protein